MLYKALLELMILQKRKHKLFLEKAIQSNLKVRIQSEYLGTQTPDTEDMGNRRE